MPSSDVYNKLNQSPTADPNVNYNMLHDVIKLAKDKHMPYKTVKYKHKKSTWITLAILKSIRYRDKLRNKLKLMHADSHEYNMTRANLMAYNAVLKNVFEQLNKCTMNRVLINSNITSGKHGTL